MGYTEYVIENTENNRIAVITDVHNCHINWYGIENDTRMGYLCDHLNEQFKMAPYDVILGLGDYSLDFWAWDIGGSCLWDSPVSNTADFVKRFCPKFPTKIFMLPGNHEQYGNEKWEEITGVKREFALVYGDKVFAMCDTFAGNLDPKENSDGTYTGINVEFLSQVLEKHSDKKVYLFMHDIIVENESENAKKLIRENKNVVCAFTGHRHHPNTYVLDDSFRNLTVFYCGDFGNSTGGRNGEANWGFRSLDFGTENGEFFTEYVTYKK